MKRHLPLLLCGLLLCNATLTACETEHTHSFQSEWTSDSTHHWHVCEGENCSELSEKEEHVWDEGEITTQASLEADGVKTYACTVCLQTKTEAVTYAPPAISTPETPAPETPAPEAPAPEQPESNAFTQADWEAALTPSAFDKTQIACYIYEKQEETVSLFSTIIACFNGTLAKANVSNLNVYVDETTMFYYYQAPNGNWAYFDEPFYAESILNLKKAFSEHIPDFSSVSFIYENEVWTATYQKELPDQTGNFTFYFDKNKKLTKYTSYSVSPQMDYDFLSEIYISPFNETITLPQGARPIE